MASPGLSETIREVGDAGAIGAAGARGGDGENVDRSVGPGDATNEAFLQAGRGGTGGVGSSASGDGGDGGRGGNVRGTATTVTTIDSASVRVEAEGGRGGHGGQFESGGPGGGGNGGAGGDAHGIGSASSTDNWGTVNLRVEGGAGGTGYGAGSFAGAAGEATVQADIDAARGGTVELRLAGGAGGSGFEGADGGRGADALLGDGISTRVGSGENSSHNESINVIGGNGGQASESAAVSGGNAGDGGNARVSRQLESISTSYVGVELDAEGGRGGRSEGGKSAGRGGDAYAEGSVGYDGPPEGTILASPRAEVRARGGAGGSGRREGNLGEVGGAAEAHAEMNSSHYASDATAIAAAFGGSGGASTGASLRGAEGQEATATAHAIAGADSIASAEVLVAGGGGGAGQQGAVGGDGAAVMLENAVLGSGGLVRLTQIADGGSGGDAKLFGGSPRGSGGRGGDSTSFLSATNLEGSLSLESDAAAGVGGEGGGAGGTARASSVGTARDDVYISVNLRGGSGGGHVGTNAIGPDGGEALLGSVRGTSTEGGEVTVRARVFGGFGGAGGTRAGDGASVELENAVDAETNGDISLLQSAWGGGISSFALPDVPRGGARGGDAVSTIGTSKSASSLRIEVESRGGDSAGFDEAGRGISGGNATSRADASNDAGDLTLIYQANGGEGSARDDSSQIEGLGGDATSILRGRTSGDGNDILIRQAGFASGSIGGLGGLGGGRGYTELEAIAGGDSEVLVEANALGGASIGASPRGGVGEAHARGRNAGISRVRVASTARGGNGAGQDGDTVIGGEAIVTAWGESSGGGDVEVEATARAGGAGAGRGGDSELMNVVGGLTTGKLRLIQNAIGGSAGENGAGNAASELHWIDQDGGELEVEANATGGGGRASGSATASASGVGEGSVGVLATANGGEGTSFGAGGGNATVGRVYGESKNGGDVRVIGTAMGGDGDDASSFGTGSPFGVGGDAALVNTVDGRTTGSLELVQTATGGDAGNASAGVEGARGGSATSALTETFEADFLDVKLEAFGGAGSQSESGALVGGAGGQARVEGTITNEIGEIQVRGRADGGDGGRNSRGFPGGHAGAASLDLTAISFGDEAPVSISSSANAGSSIARGGRNPAPSGASASARSRSVGEARGDSRVDVRDTAGGGSGTRGGSATSEANGSNQGASAVFVDSRARAGRSDVPVRGLGDAVSTATGASSTGAVTVQSSARTDTFGVSRSPLLLSSNALALARSAGTGGEVNVESTASHITGRAGELGFAVTSNARGAFASNLTSEAAAGRSNPQAIFSSTASASVMVSGVHERDGEWTRAGMNLRSNIEDLDIELATEIDLSLGFRPERLEGVFVSFLDVQFGDDFSELMFRIEYGDTMVVDETFSDRESISAFFGQVLNLGLLDPGDPFPFADSDTLRIILEGKGAALASSFGIVFAVGTVAIPEPGTALLLGFGLCLLARPRRTHL